MRISLFLSCVLVVLIAGGNTVSAQPIAGCDPTYWDAATKVARANVVGDVAVIEENQRQKDSVLALTCFDQASRVSANEGGKIFSGDFTADMNQVVNQPLINMLQTNFLDSIGNSGDWSNIVFGALGSLFSGLFPPLFSSSSYDCTVMQDLWDDYQTAPINPRSTRFPTFQQMVTWSSGAPSDNFLANLVSEGGGGAIGQASTAVTALPTPVLPSTAGTQTLNQVLIAVGVLP